MPGRKQQKDRDLKRAAESCDKITDLFKKKARKESQVQESQENPHNIDQFEEPSSAPDIASISGLPMTSDQQHKYIYDLNEMIPKRFLLMLIAINQFLPIDSGKIKVVDGPFSFNNPLSESGRKTQKPLMVRITPQVPSGPPYIIEKLNGKCFDYMANSYKYIFCPFQNVTQREQTYRWNAFQGVLGVWRHWSIENGTFASMVMVRGEVCMGTLDREVKVKLRCGEISKIISVNEPETCRYVMIFHTPYACPQDVFEVYPLLSESGKTMFVQMERDYELGITTKQGYEKQAKILYEDEGLHFPLQSDNKADESVRSKQDFAFRIDANVSNSSHLLEGTATQVKEITNTFVSKQHCIQRYEELYGQLVDLRRQLDKYHNATKNSLPNYESNDSGDSTVPPLLSKNGSLSVVRNVGKYKFGELGDAHGPNASLNNGRLSGRRLNVAAKTIDNLEKGGGDGNSSVIIDRTKTLSHKRPVARNNKPRASDDKRGDTGTVEELDNPNRHLLDRLHENNATSDRVALRETE